MDQVLENLIGYARTYFPVEATLEMLNEFRPLLCPWDTSIEKGFDLLNLFLPTRLTPLEHENQGFGLWIGEVFLINTNTRQLISTLSAQNLFNAYHKQ